MIAIKGMSMPKSCRGCGLLGKEEMYCSIYPRKEIDIITVATARPDWCPLVELEGRKTGKWEYQQLGFRKYGLVCTSCGYAIRLGYDFTSMEEFKDMVESKLQNPHITMDKYCCKCGAEMKGEQQ